jgi:hypothetical protein
MCLDKFYSIPPKLFKKEHGHYVGWKTYGISVNTKILLSQYYGQSQPIGTWIHEKDYRESFYKFRVYLKTTDKEKKYPLGFHIYLKRPRDLTSDNHSRIRFSIRKVYFDEIVKYGIQNQREIVVAKKIKILRQRKRK